MSFKEQDQFNQAEATIQQKLALNAITLEEATRYRQNFRFLHEQRSYLEETFSCTWVASIEGSFYDRYYLNDLHKVIQNVPYGDRAYIEHIHPGVNRLIAAKHNISPPKPSKPTPN